MATRFIEPRADAPTMSCSPLHARVPMMLRIQLYRLSPSGLDHWSYTPPVLLSPNMRRMTSRRRNERSVRIATARRGGGVARRLRERCKLSEDERC